jgi:hypothetical protein
MGGWIDIDRSPHHPPTTQAHVVVGTPATTLRGIQNRTLDVSAVKFLTLDEADQLLDQKNKVCACVWFCMYC